MSEPQTPPSADGIDARFEQLEQLLARLVKAFNGHREATGEELDRLAATLADVQKMLAPTSDTPAVEGPDVVAWNDRATAQQWHDLAAWVDWLIETYEFRAEARIHPCWPATPASSRSWRPCGTRGATLPAGPWPTAPRPATTTRWRSGMTAT